MIRLDKEDHQICFPDGLHIRGRIRSNELDFPLLLIGEAHGIEEIHGFFPDIDKPHLLPGIGQKPTEEASHRSSTHHHDFHLFSLKRRLLRN